LVIWVYQGLYAVPLSILVGTAVGLPIKYVLEKRHIFAFESDNLAHDGRLFVLYTVMGVFTTAIFWGVEYAFHRIFGTDVMRYLGGIIGLTLGYVIKYFLDKRFVFVNRAPVAPKVA
jgi:putative flippase GtrA